MQSYKPSLNLKKSWKKSLTLFKKNKLYEQRRLLKSAAAQFVAAGQLYNSNPTQENEQKMKDAETVVGSHHKKTTELMKLHSENRFTVDPAQQRQYLIKEMKEALARVQEWQDQYELMQIDADTFYTAADRLVRAYTSIIKNVLANIGRDAQINIAKQVQAWSVLCQQYRDIFLPRSEKKWEKFDFYSVGGQVFSNLTNLHTAITKYL